MNRLLAGVCILVAMCMCSCKSEQSMIEESAFGYLTAMGNYQIKEAEAYASDETIENTLHAIEKYIMPNLDSAFINKNTPATIEIKQVNQINDTFAEVSYVKTTPIQVQKGTLDMVKCNKKWKAQVKIAIPEVLKFEKQVDSKALDEKYKGKLKAGKKGEVPPSSTRIPSNE